jgi:hypothetical protein
MIKIEINEHKLSEFKYVEVIKFKNKGLMINRSDSSPRLEQVYREYVEFTNDSHIVSPLSILFMALSHVVILADLLVKLAPNNYLVQNITYLGVSPMLLEIVISDQNLAHLLNIIIMVILMSPLYAVLTIICQGYWCTHS